MTVEELYPVFLRLEGRRVVVVGGGPVAERVTLELLRARAAVRIVAPSLTKELRRRVARGDFEWKSRRFRATDVASAWIVAGATGDPKTQRSIARACEIRRCFLIAVDDIDNASAFGAAVVRRGPVTGAIATSGQAPALARLLREMFDSLLPNETWVEEAIQLRARWKEEKVPMDRRFPALLSRFAELAASARKTARRSASRRSKASKP